MVCPKCGVQIKRFDLSPQCKNCGVHIMYYTQEQDLARDAKKTELEFAKARLFTGKLKCAFVGSKLAIARMVAMVAVLGVLFVPCGSINISLPFFSEQINVSGLGLYQLIGNGTYGVIADYLNSGLARDAVIKLLIWYIAFVLTVLSVGVLFVMWLLCFTDIKKGAVRLSVNSIVSAVLALITAVMGLVANAGVNTCGQSIYSFLQVSCGMGAYVISAVLIAFFVINRLIIKSGMAPKTSPVDLQRIAIGKQVKNGEIDIDSLSLPILETEEERQKRLNAFGDTQNTEKKKKEGAVS